MLRSTHFAALITCLMFLQCCLCNASEIIETTDYHADEANVTTKGSWLGLQKNDKGWRLVSVNPKFSRVDDAILGAGNGIRVSTNPADFGILLMDDSLTPGPVLSVLEGQSHELTPEQSYENSRLPNVGEEKTYNLNKNKYALKNVDGEIILEFQGKTQTLFSYSEGGDTDAKIVWIGDLDRDGKLDLILDASDHPNVGELRMYLSGKAQVDFGYIVALVARRRSTGC